LKWSCYIHWECTYVQYSTFLRGRRDPTRRYKARTTSTDRAWVPSCSDLPARRARHRDVAPDAAAPGRSDSTPAPDQQPWCKTPGVPVCQSETATRSPARAGRLYCGARTAAREVKTACVRACRPGCAPRRETCWAGPLPAG
jgi:hypothetical protein